MSSNACDKLHCHTHLKQTQTYYSKQFKNIQCKLAHKFLVLVSHIETEYEQNARLSLRIPAYAEKSYNLLKTSHS